MLLGEQQEEKNAKTKKNDVMNGLLVSAKESLYPLEEINGVFVP